MNLKLLAAYLRKEKIQYREASNGQEALERYVEANGNFALVLIDIGMPIMDGLTATRLIRAWEKEHGVKRAQIVTLTALASAASRAEAREAGVDEYVTKPVNFKNLQELLRRRLSGSMEK